MKKILFIMLVIMLLAAALGALGEFPSWLDGLWDINISGGGSFPEPPVDNTCKVCGKDPCICNPEPPVDNTCKVCGKDPCICDPEPPVDNTCKVCGKDPCICNPEPPVDNTCRYCGVELIEGSCCNSSCPYYGECPDCATMKVDGECPNPDCPGKIEICEECGFELSAGDCLNSECVNYFYRRDCDCGEWWDSSVWEWCQNPECPYVCSICGSDRTDGVCTNPDCTSKVPDEPEIIFTTTLSEDGIITIIIQEGEYAESGYRLYDEAGNVLGTVGAETTLTWDISSYLTAGQKYYVDGRLWTKVDMKEITVRSEVITYSGPGTLCETCKIGYVKGSGNCTYSYCSTHYDHCTVTLGADKVAFVSPEAASEYNFTLYRFDGQEYAEVAYYGALGSSCDFSSNITEGIYYVTCTLCVYDDMFELHDVITLVSENVTFESGMLLCSVCNEGYKDVATGLCSNENCPSHNSDVTYKVTFSSAGIAECEGASDATWMLYDADTEETVHTVYATGTPVDFSLYMEDGKSYYVSVHDITDDDTFGTYYSDTVRFSDGGSTKLTCRVCNVGYIAEGGTCSNANCITNNPDSYYVTLGTTGAAACAKVNDATWTLYNADTDEVVDTINAAGTPVDFSSYMEDGKSYYVIVSSISGDDTNGTYRSNTITFSKNEDDGFTKLICTACNVGYITEGGACSNVNCSVNNSDTYTVILGATGAAACAKVSDATWTLYDADTNAEVCTISATASPVDFSSHMEDGKSYYVIVSSISGDDTNGTYRSGTITFSNNDDSGSVKLTCDACNVGYITEGGTCSNTSCITNNPNSYYVTLGTTGAVACAKVSDATWTLYDADTGEEVHTISATSSPVDFSSHMESGKSYYVIVEGISGDSTHGTYRSNTITFSNDDDNDDDLSGTLCPYCKQSYILEGTGKCSTEGCENYHG